MTVYLLISMLVLLLGHICKIYRWKQLIAMHEDVRPAGLARAMVYGQVTNLIIPFRLGDLVRIYSAGKYLKNGFALSIATVIADLYLDTITVGFSFAVLYALGFRNDGIFKVTIGYVVLSLALIVVTVCSLALKKYLKKIIQKIASVFNPRTELRILYTSYAILASLKNIYKKVNIVRLVLFTVGMWTGYFVSYDLFARYMNTRYRDIVGTEYSMITVFKQVFSFNSIRFWRTGFSIENMMFIMFLVIPLILLGIYGVIRKTKAVNQSWNHILPQQNENERLAFLEVYFGVDEKSEYINAYLNLNRDINVIRDYSAGSNATTLLCMKEDRTFFRKCAFGDDAIILKDQMEWMERNRSRFPVAKVIGNSKGEGYFSYDMEYYAEAVNYFQYIHSATVDQSWKVLENILNKLNTDLYKGNACHCDRDTLSAFIDKKVNDNLDFCTKNSGKWIKSLMAYDNVVINSVTYPNLSHYLYLFDKDYLMSSLENENITDIHGDLTIENIVCFAAKAESNWYLIDPNPAGDYRVPSMDYAKVLQSLHGGYEILMLVREVDILENNIQFLYSRTSQYNALLEKYMLFLNDNFNREEIIRIYLQECIHWLRLIPYKVRKNPRQAVIFYCGLLMVLKDVEEYIGTTEDNQP